MSVINRDGSYESTFSKKRVRWCTSFANLDCCSWNWKNGRSETKSLSDSTSDEFLDLPRHILEFATTENNNESEISVVGRSGCGLSVNMKIVGEGTNAVIKFWLFLSMQCSRDVEYRGKARLHKNKRLQLGPGKRIRTKKVTSKLEQGLNFTVIVDFWFCKYDFYKKPDGKKRDFCRFSMTSKTVIFVIVQI